MSVPLKAPPEAGRADAESGVDAGSVLRRHGRTFAMASHLLGARHAARAATLYAFCRHVDDLADEARDPEAARAALSAVLDALDSGRGADRWTAAMRDLQRETGMPRAPARDLIAGVVSDLGAVRMTDETQLIRYAYRVAGTVGLMMCAVLDVDDPRAAPFAIDLGIAMQLTNIARDVGEDAGMDRRYLPASWVGELAPSAILSPDAAQQSSLRCATRRLLALADRYYESGESGLGFLPLRARLGILAAARMYRAIGGRIASQGHCSWAQRAVLGPLSRTGHAAQAVLWFALSPRLHRRDAAHESALQRALRGMEDRHA